MAISIGGNTVKNKSDGGKVTYNGKECAEVWYKSSPSATAVKVWPDDILFHIVGIIRTNSSKYSPAHQACKTSSAVDVITGPDTTSQHSGGKNISKFEFNTRPGDGFEWTTYGNWKPTKVAVYVNRREDETYDAVFTCNITGNRDTLAKGIKVIYDGQFKLRNVRSSDINLSTTTKVKDRLGAIEKLRAIEFDFGGLNGLGSDCLEIRLYFNDGKAYLTQNHWPKVYSSGNKGNMIDHNPKWTQIKVISEENPNSRYFERPKTLPFTCKFFPVVSLSDYPLQYWTLEKPDGTVLRFEDTDAHTITIDQPGEWKENSYWGNTISEVPLKTAGSNSGDAFAYLFKNKTDSVQTATYSLNGGAVKQTMPFELSDNMQFSFGGLCTINKVIIQHYDDNYNVKSQAITRPGNISLNTKSLWVNFAKDSSGWYISGGNSTKVYLNSDIQTRLNDLSSWKNVWLYYTKYTYLSTGESGYEVIININNRNF